MILSFKFPFLFEPFFWINLSLSSPLDGFVSWFFNSVSNSAISSLNVSISLFISANSFLKLSILSFVSDTSDMKMFLTTSTGVSFSSFSNLSNISKYCLRFIVKTLPLPIKACIGKNGLPTLYANLISL